jgi:hypothetical protein
MMRKYIVRGGQSLTDIALEAYGSATGVHWLLEDNVALNRNLSALPTPGTTIVIRDEVPPDSASIQLLMQRDGVKIANAPNEQTIPTGYMDAEYVSPDYVE